MYKKILAIGIISILILSVVTPMVAGNNIYLTIKKKNHDINDLLEKLAFAFSNRYDPSKLDYYQELIQKDKPEDIENDIPLILAESFSIISSGPMNSAWPMKCHDVHHTSQSPYSTVDNPGIEKWRFHFTGGLEDTPVIDNNGTIYCKGTYNQLDRYLYAINPDGTEKWKYKTDGLIWGSSPAIAVDGTIYVGSWDDKLYAINPDGTLKWRIGTGGTISSSPAIAEDGTIYLGTMRDFDKGDIVAINPNGTVKWSYLTNYLVSSDPAIGDDGTIYIGSGDTYLYALWPNGTLRWRFKTGDIVKSHPMIDNNGIVYFDSFDGYLYALYSNNGTLKWMNERGSGVSSGCIGNDGVIYYSGINKLRAYYPDGSIKWSFNLDNRKISHGSLAISADGIIYFGVEIGDGDGGEIIAVKNDGTEQWRKRIANKWVDSSPSIAEDGTVYIGSTYDMGKGYLHAFGPQESNDPPEPPSITGPPNGKIDASYTFSFLSTDPDRNPISYYVNWGDGTNSGWTEDVNTGELVTLSHTWKHVNTFTIRAKVRDTFGLESDETEFKIKISNPRTKTWMQFLDIFPILQRILGFIK